MTLRRGRGLRRIDRLLRLIGRERSQHRLRLLERDIQGPLPLHQRAFVRYEKYLY
jgi:hypothetical protein